MTAPPQICCQEPGYMAWWMKSAASEPALALAKQAEEMFDNYPAGPAMNLTEAQQAEVLGVMRALALAVRMLAAGRV